MRVLRCPMRSKCRPVVAGKAVNKKLGSPRLVASHLDFEMNVGRRPAVVPGRFDRAEVILASRPGQEPAKALEIGIELRAVAPIRQVNPAGIGFPYLYRSVSDRLATSIEQASAQMGYFADSRRDRIIHDEQVIISIQGEFGWVERPFLHPGRFTRQLIGKGATHGEQSRPQAETADKTAARSGSCGRRIVDSRVAAGAGWGVCIKACLHTRELRHKTPVFHFVSKRPICRGEREWRVIWTRKTLGAGCLCHARRYIVFVPGNNTQNKGFMKRSASAVWEGNLKDGKGTISTESGVLSKTSYSFSTRFENGRGTNPEEPVAAAHAGCFSMALSAELGKASITPESIHTTANLAMERLEAGWTVTAIHLDVNARIPGGDKSKFEAAADAAKAGRPISRLLNTKITMEARLSA